MEGDLDSLVFFKDENYLCAGTGVYGITILKMTNTYDLTLVGKSEKTEYSVEDVQISSD